MSEKKKSHIEFYSNMYHIEYPEFIEEVDEIDDYIFNYINHLKGGLYMIHEIDKFLYVELYTMLDSIHCRMRVIDYLDLDLINELIEFKHHLYVTLRILLYYSKEYVLHDEVDVEPYLKKFVDYL